MGTMTYYVALAFKEVEEDGGDIVARDPRESRSSEHAIRMAASLAVEEEHCGAIAFSRAGDPALGDFGAWRLRRMLLILKTIDEIDIGLLSALAVARSVS